MSNDLRSELPAEQEKFLRKAIRLEWITIVFLIFDIGLLYITMGQSQAMKTAWFDNALSLTPPIVFLISNRWRQKKPTRRFPYGFHRTVSIAFLIASTALLTMGLYLLIDSVYKLILADHPTIGTMKVFGQLVWAGWPMIAASAWSGISAATLGHLKLPLGPKLHNKVIQADATMNKADWMMSAATIAGILGVGFGWWWADGIAAAFISVEILKDGFHNIKEAFSDLIDRTPEKVDGDEEDPFVAQVRDYFANLPWVEASAVRMHEQGNVFVGEALIVPTKEQGLISNIEKAIHDLDEMDWRLKDFAITPLTRREFEKDQP